MPEKKRIDATLLIYGRADLMGALRAEEKLRMANGERSPLEAFSTIPDREDPAWTMFRIHAKDVEWDRADPWVDSFYRLMARLREREQSTMSPAGVVENTRATLRYEFACAVTPEVYTSMEAYADRPLREFVEVERTLFHEYRLEVGITITARNP